MSENTIQTRGEKLVGLDFNPSDNKDVTKIKQHIAAIIDLIYDLDGGKLDDVTHRLPLKLREYATHDLIQAQMMAVKFITSI